MDAERLSQLTIAQLHTFRHVMKEGGYAAAARVSHLSVPSVWQHIQAVEKCFGVRLFERSGRQVTPTESAHRLYLQVEKILVQLESTLDVVADNPADKPIRLVVGVRMMLEDLALPLATFRQRHANRLALRQGNDQRAQELLLADEADIALVLEPGVNQESSRIHYEPAYMVEFLAVSKKSHPYAKAKSGSLRELAKHDLVVTATGTHGRDALDQALHRESLSANIVVETDNSAYTIACVTAGMGVGVLAGRSNGRLCRNLATRSLSKSLGQRRIVFMWRKGRILTEPMTDLLDLVRGHEQ